MEKTLLEIEGADSAGLQFLNNYILLVKDVGLPNDQPGYMNVVAICDPNATVNWEIRRGLPFIEEDTVPGTTAFDSIWTIRTYKSVKEKKRQYLIATIKGQEDFPQIYSFLGSDNAKAKILGSGIVELLLNWPTIQTEMSFTLRCQEDSRQTHLTIDD